MPIIIGLIVGVLVLVGIVVAVIFYFRNKPPTDTGTDGDMHEVPA